MKLSKLALVIIILIPFVFGIGCSDKSSNSNDDIPAELVGSWLYLSGTIDGEPMTPENYEYQSELATGHSITFNANGSYSGVEYDDGMNPVSTRSGTFRVKADSVYVTWTEIDGAPVSPAEEDDPLTYEISGSVLILTSVDTGGPYNPIVVLIYESM